LFPVIRLLFTQTRRNQKIPVLGLLDVLGNKEEEMYFQTWQSWHSFCSRKSWKSSGSPQVIKSIACPLVRERARLAPRLHFRGEGAMAESHDASEKRLALLERKLQSASRTARSTVSSVLWGKRQTNAISSFCRTSALSPKRLLFAAS
jgi:hypothetical protein